MCSEDRGSPGRVVYPFPLNRAGASDPCPMDVIGQLQVAREEEAHNDRTIVLSL